MIKFSLSLGENIVNPNETYGTVLSVLIVIVHTLSRSAVHDTCNFVRIMCHGGEWIAQHNNICMYVQSLRNYRIAVVYIYRTSPFPLS